MDTAGPLPQSMQHNKYLAVAVDNHSGHISALPVKNKSAAGTAIARALRQLQLACRRKVKRLHSDGAPELCAGAPLKLAHQTGPQITTTVKDTPKMNGQAERAIGILKNCARAQLSASNISNKFWDYAVQDCADKLNKIPKIGQIVSPHELLYSKIPKLIDRFLPFGTFGFIPNKNAGTKSLDPRGLLRRYLRSPNESIFQVLDPKTKRVNSCRPSEFSP